MSDAAVETVAPAAPAAEATEEQAIQSALAAMQAAEPQEASAAPDGAPAEAKADEEKPPEGPAATGWARVAKKEKKLVERERAIKAQSEKTEQALAQINARMAELDAREKALDADPLAYLQKRGVTFDDLARRVIGDGKVSPEEAQRRGMTAQEARLKEIADRQERIERSIQEGEVKKHVDNYRAGITSTLAQPEFELLRGYPDAETEVYEFAEKWAAKTGEVLTQSQAAERLQAQFSKELDSLASNATVRSRLLAGANGQPQRVSSGHSQVPQRQPGESPKTLTNHLAGAPPRGEPDWASMSEDEQIAHALRLAPE
jgi:hypothetical protein